MPQSEAVGGGGTGGWGGRCSMHPWLGLPCPECGTGHAVYVGVDMGAGASWTPQPYLDFDPEPLRRGDPLEAAALAFHQANPHVLQEIAKVCLLVREKGRRRWSMKAAFEVVRYNATVTTDHRTYKLNNNHTAFYARWLMRDFTELAGFFVTREAGRVPQAYDE